MRKDISVSLGIERFNLFRTPPVHGLPSKTPLPSPPRGRSYLLIKPIIELEKHPPHQPRTEADFMPSPLGEGQTDKPINRHNRGEVYYDAGVG